MLRTSCFCAKLVCLLLPLVTNLKSWALDAKQVFERIAPSTVLIRDLDCSGSGIVLTDQGMILTNLHVVSAHIALEVRAKVKTGTSIVETKFEDVKLIKVHPRYDLALIQVSLPKGSSLVPAQMISKEVKVATGSNCFVVGNPGGPGGISLDLSVTQGIVSSASRNVEGLDYMQISAALNPGNSGGPVCDDLGRVFGIATWKMTETEGIGFAIPSQKLVLAEFVEPQMRQPNPRLADEAQKAGDQYFHLARLTSGQEREMLLAAASQCFHVMLEAMPNDPAPYHNIGITYKSLGDKSTAKKYFEAALKIKPNYPATCSIFGVVLAEEDPANVERSLSLWFLGLTSDATRDEDRLEAGMCAEGIAITMGKQQKALPCAYALRWAEVVSNHNAPPDRQKVRDNMWRELQTLLPPEQLAAIKSKKEGFSKLELDALLQGKSLNEAVSKIAEARPIGNNKTQMETVAKQAAAVYGPQQIAPPSDGLELPLPDEPRQVLLSNAGWHLAMHFTNLDKIGIFNLAAGKFDGFIDCLDDNALIASGGKVLAVYLPSTDTYELYDLSTLELKISKKSPLPGPTVFIGMGLLNEMEILSFCSFSDKVRFTQFLNASILSLPNLGVIDLNPTGRGDEPFRNSTNTQFFDGGMNDSGSCCVLRRPTVSPTGLFTYEIKAGNIVEGHYEHATVDRASLSSDGSFVVMKKLMRRIGLEKDRYEKGEYGALLVPVAGMPAVVSAKSGSAQATRNYYSRSTAQPSTTTTNQGFAGFVVQMIPAMNPYLEFPVNVERMNQLITAGMSPKGFAVASAYCDRLAVISGEEKKISVFALGFHGKSQDGVFAEPGTHFQRKLNLDQGSTATLQSAPAAMKYDPASDSLKWDVPADIKRNQMIQVVILVKNAVGKQDYRIEKISVP